MATKQKLLEELDKIRTKETEAADKKRRTANYDKFKNRIDDAVIGRAHAEFDYPRGRGGWRTHGRNIGDCISIHGNCGTSYNAQAPVTDDTYTYFHNVWQDEDRRAFQAKLDELAVKEVQRIMGKLRNVLEIMGLQSNGFFITSDLPPRQAKRIKDGIWLEAVKVLDKYSDKDFIGLKQVTHWTNCDTGKTTPTPELNLSHSRGIVKQYIKGHRKHLLPEFKDIFKQWF